MKTRLALLALAALAATSLSAFSSTAASASEWGVRGHGYFGNDYGRYPRPHHVDPCECEAPAPVRNVYVPYKVKVPVYVPVKVKVPVYVPVRERVYIPVPQKTAEPCDCEAPIATQTHVPAPRPSHIEAAPMQTAEPCDCEEPEFTQGPQTRPHTYPGTGPQYDQTRRPASFASTAIEKK